MADEGGKAIVVGRGTGRCRNRPRDAAADTHVVFGGADGARFLGGGLGEAHGRITLNCLKFSNNEICAVLGLLFVAPTHTTLGWEGIGLNTGDQTNLFQNTILCIQDHPLQLILVKCQLKQRKCDKS